MAERFAVIMAGGVGARFWPASRRSRPKQLLPLAGGNEPLLSATRRRLGAVVPPDHVYVVTNESLAEATRALLPDLPSDQVLAEPCGRNTAPCIGWAAATIARRDPEALIAVLPADHHIGDEPAYAALLERAAAAAEDGRIVTIGIRPSRPETGYGYLEVGDSITDGVHHCLRFIEKPDRARALEFLEAGQFLWNSGMFFFRADVILDAIRAHLPKLASALAEFDDAARRGTEAARVADLYAGLSSVSIDHGVMEKADRVAVVPGECGWSDLGSWTTAWELSDKDEAQNATSGDVLTADTSGCYVRAPEGKVVALVGVRDLVVVDTEDALLVIPRERAQDVRQIVDQLSKRGDERR